MKKMMMKITLTIILSMTQAFSYTKYIHTDTLQADSILRAKWIELTSLNAGGIVKAITSSGRLEIAIPGVDYLTGVPDSARVSGLSHSSKNADSLNHHPGAWYESSISLGTTSQYWRGDKTWQTLSPVDSSKNSNHAIVTDSAIKLKTGAAITGSGTGGYLSRWNGTYTQGLSSMQDDLNGLLTDEASTPRLILKKSTSTDGDYYSELQLFNQGSVVNNWLSFNSYNPGCSGNFSGTNIPHAKLSLLCSNGNNFTFSNYFYKPFIFVNGDGETNPRYTTIDTFGITIERKNPNLYIKNSIAGDGEYESYMRMFQQGASVNNWMDFHVCNPAKTGNFGNSNIKNARLAVLYTDAEAFLIGNYYNKPIYLINGIYNGTPHYLKMAPTGNIFIGNDTTSGTKKLHVGGSIMCDDTVFTDKGVAIGTNNAESKLHIQGNSSSSPLIVRGATPYTSYGIKYNVGNAVAVSGTFTRDTVNPPVILRDRGSMTDNCVLKIVDFNKLTQIVGVGRVWVSQTDQNYGYCEFLFDKDLEGTPRIYTLHMGGLYIGFSYTYNDDAHFNIYLATGFPAIQQLYFQNMLGETVKIMYEITTTDDF